MVRVTMSHLGYLQSRNIRRTDEDEALCAVETPDGVLFPLSAEMLATAKVFPHGNWSKLRVTIELEVDFLGSVETTKSMFARRLATKIEALKDDVATAKANANAALAKVAQLEADARAAAVVQSAILATNGSK